MNSNLERKLPEKYSLLAELGSRIISIAEKVQDTDSAIAVLEKKLTRLRKNRNGQMELLKQTRQAHQDLTDDIRAHETREVNLMLGTTENANENKVRSAKSNGKQTNR